jgi:hypothetical protein
MQPSVAVIIRQKANKKQLQYIDGHHEYSTNVSVACN